MQGRGPLRAAPALQAVTQPPLCQSAPVPPPRHESYLGAEPIGHATHAPPWHAGCGHHLLLRWRFGPRGDDAHCGANQKVRLNPPGAHGQGPSKMPGAPGRHGGARWSGTSRSQRCTLVESRLFLCVLLLPALREPLSWGSGGDRSLHLFLALLEARLGLRGESRTPVRPCPAWGPRSAWG